MKFLLTSAGVKNASIRTALIELLERPIEESTALCIPTAMYGHPQAGPYRARQFTSGRSAEPLVDLGWKSVGQVEDRALGLVDFAICPHLADAGSPGNTGEEALAWARTMPCPTLVIGDETAIRVVGTEVDVLSEGHGERFPDRAAATSALEQLAAGRTR